MAASTHRDAPPVLARAAFCRRTEEHDSRFQLRRIAIHRPSCCARPLVAAPIRVRAVGRAAAVERVPSLDGLRALAIGGVYGLHLQGQAFPGGAIGVDLFFVLSGYLITSGLLVERRDTGRTCNSAAFYWPAGLRPAHRAGARPAARRRAAPRRRAAFSAVQGGGAAIGWGTVAVLSYSTNFLEAWSGHIVPAYNQGCRCSRHRGAAYYLLWPIEVLLVGLRPRPSALGCAPAPSWRSSRVAEHCCSSHPTTSCRPRTYSRWRSGAVPRSSSRPALRAWQAQCSATRGRARRPRACCSRSCLLTCPSRRPGGHRPAGDLAAVFLTAHCALRRRSIPARALASPLPRWIGERSYGIYLYGLTAMHLIGLLTGLPGLQAAPIDIAATGLLVAASYRMSSRRCARPGRTVADRRSREQSVSAPTVAVRAVARSGDRSSTPRATEGRWQSPEIPRHVLARQRRPVRVPRFGTSAPSDAMRGPDGARLSRRHPVDRRAAALRRRSGAPGRRAPARFTTGTSSSSRVTSRRSRYHP